MSGVEKQLDTTSTLLARLHPDPEGEHESWGLLQADPADRQELVALSGDESDAEVLSLWKDMPPWEVVDDTPQ
jgi:hypothetical protein